MDTLQATVVLFVAVISLVLVTAREKKANRKHEANQWRESFRRSQRDETGFAMLIELVVVSVVMLTLLAMATPTWLQAHRAMEQTAAKAWLVRTAATETSIAQCAAQTPVCGQMNVLNATLPPVGSTVQSGYVFTFVPPNETGNFTMTAVPLNPTEHLKAFTIGSNGVLAEIQ